MSSHFAMLEREIKEMVTEKTDSGEEVFREDLLKEPWLGHIEEGFRGTRER